MKTLLSIGHGYVARHLAGTLLPRGWKVIGTTRSADHAGAIAAQGAEPLIWPGASLEDAVAQASHILISVPPGPDGCPVAAAMPKAPHLKWVGYLSTTGVYRDSHGAWIDESAPLAVAGSRGAKRVIAEAQWQALDLPLQIFRLAGIYGPGRSAFERIKAPRAQRIIRPDQVFCRIHVEDIVAGLRASIAQPMPGAIWNMADLEPAPASDVLEEAARLIGVDPPPAVPFEEAEMSAMLRSFYDSSKRIDASRLRADLGLSLRYPTYREGLRAILAQRDA